MTQHQMKTTSIPQVPWATLTLWFLVATCCKILLMPSYRSTDFDVHRNWLAITRHLQVKEWYYDDVNGTTVHTLDYPPSFAFFEYLLANNPVTNYLLKANLLDERCLALLPDSDNTPTQSCIIFHRSTVIVSDVVLWWGAWVASSAAGTGQVFLGQAPASFWLMVFHPGLLWLDHVHFQYNGMLFGIFLASLGYLWRGNSANNENDKKNSFHTNHWKAAVLFALLLTMKHLFLTLAPFYFVYLLRRYCFEENTTNSSLKLLPLRLVTLGMYTATMLLVPFLPFLKQMPQLGSRLFPFGRGLVHDYWAANVWALYSFGDKVMGVLGRPSLPDIPASWCGLLLLVSLLPGLYHGAWKAAAQRDNSRLVLAVVYSAMASFQLGFHVHEKAILNAIVPLTLLVTRKPVTSKANEEMLCHPGNLHWFRVLFLQMTALGLVGIFPLLFRSVEFPMKLMSYVAYMAVCYHLLLNQNDIELPQSTNLQTQLQLLPLAAMIVAVISILEVVPISLFGKMEFLPLLCTSVGCAVGLIYCWIRLFVIMVR